MEHVNKTALAVYGIIGAIITAVSKTVAWVPTAVIVMALGMFVDWITGFGLAFIFHKSNKTVDGGIESRAGWKGIYRKTTTLLLCALLYIATHYILGTNILADYVCYVYFVNDIVSITENLALAGAPMPDAVLNVLSVIRKQIDQSKPEESTEE